MGYSIAARAQNRTLLNKMTAFMEKYYREDPFKLEIVFSRRANNLGPKNTHLSYDNNPMAIGFDYNACEPERDYIFAVTRWMALKIGSLTPKRHLGKVPYIAYDGGHCQDDRMPVLIREKWEDKISEEYRWALVDSVGFKPSHLKFIGVSFYDDLKTQKEKEAFIQRHSRIHKNLCGFNFEEIDKIIKKELGRLERLWKKTLDD